MNRIVIITLCLAVAVNLSQIIDRPSQEVCGSFKIPKHDRSKLTWIMCEPSINWFNTNKGTELCVICNTGKGG